MQYNDGDQAGITKLRLAAHSVKVGCFFSQETAFLIMRVYNPVAFCYPSHLKTNIVMTTDLFPSLGIDSI